MNLVLRSILFHFDTHWSNPRHFWAGVVGMFINNALTLLGIWAMLFAGKENLSEARNLFFAINFILMFAWGAIMVFLGGVSNLDKLINEGSLDLAMTTPRSPVLVLSLTSSHLPAWGDLILGFLGLGLLGIKFGIIFFLQAIAISLFAILALFSFFLFVGCLAFWFRRTEAIHSVLINMCLAYNTYPIINEGSAMRWVLFVVPILLVGVIPANVIINPSWRGLALEVCGSFVCFLGAHRFFSFGMKRYQSTSVLGLQRL
jgi:ABC-2 type transport system permease protein